MFRSGLDNILGVLYVKDIIGVSEPFSLEHYFRKAIFYPGIGHSSNRVSKHAAQPCISQSWWMNMAASMGS